VVCLHHVISFIFININRLQYMYNTHLYRPYLTFPTHLIVLPECHKTVWRHTICIPNAPDNPAKMPQDCPAAHHVANLPARYWPVVAYSFGQHRSQCVVVGKDRFVVPPTHRPRPPPSDKVAADELTVAYIHTTPTNMYADHYK
jgi:hypothetical protein